MFKKIKKWWRGKDTFYENKPNDPVIIIGWNNKKHWTSSLVHWVVSLFVNPERRAIFLAILGFITFIFMLLKYFSSTDVNQDISNPKGENREPVAQIHTQAN